MADFDKKVALIEVDIDQAAAKKQVEDLTGSIIDQKKAIKDNTDEIKKLNNGTEDQQKQAKELEKQNFKLRDELKDLNKERSQAVKATKLQANSLDALRKKVVDQKKELNGLNKATEEGQRRFDQLSKELKENNEQIKELDQSAGDFKTNVGDYPDLLGDIGGGLGGTIQGFKGLTAASLKFIATPVGLVLGAIAAALALVKNAMNRSEESTNRVTRAFAPLEGVINLVLKGLEPLGEFLIEGIVQGFELAAKAASFFTDALADGLSFLGFEEAAQGVRDFKEEVQEASEAAVKLADDEAKLREELRRQERVQLDFQRAAEKLRQIRDDESKSIEEQIQANRELGQVLQKQSEEELRIANLQLSVINQRIAIEGERSDLLDQQAEALTKIAEINERITGQESEQLVNVNSLRKEQNDLIREQQELKAKEAEEEAKRIEEANRTRIENEIQLNEKLRELEDFRRNQKFEGQIQELENDQEVFDLRLEQENENFESELEAIQEREERLRENEELTAEERAIQQAEIDLAKEEALADHKDKILDITKQKNASIEKEESKSEKNKQKIASAGQSVVSKVFETTNNKIGDFYDNRIKEVERLLAEGQINEETAARRIEKIEQNKAIAQWRADRASFRLQQAKDITGIALDTARAQTKARAASPTTFGEPFAGAAIALGIVQGALVASKRPPQRPSFAEGGTVIGGRDHSQGGEDIFVGGRLVGNMQGGEGLFVTKREATANALSFMNQQAGGRSFFGTSSRYLQEGGRVDTSTADRISREDIMDIMSSLPPLEVQATSVMGAVEAEQKSNDLGIV